MAALHCAQSGAHGEGITLVPFISVQVNVDAFSNDIIEESANEPSLAIDPQQKNRIAVGWRRFDQTSLPANYFAGVSHSTDGGTTWSEMAYVDVLAGQPQLPRSDPVLDYSADGKFYYYSLNRSAFPRTCDQFISTDGGQSWTMDTDADLVGGDKPWIAVDRTGGPGDGNVYIHWWHQCRPFPMPKCVLQATLFSDRLSGTMPARFA